MLENMLIAWIPHGIHMVHICMMEIKEYDIKAHAYDMRALRKKHGR